MALAVSGHGFGHAVRCAEVAQALLNRGTRVVVRTDAPRWLFPEAVEIVPSPGWPLDVGVVQHDGLDLDVDETRRRWADFASDFDARAEVEAGLLRQHGADVLVGDVPPLAFAAAARAGVPAFALGNFGWDWIYAAWPDFDTVIARIRASHATVRTLLRLPLHSTTQDAFASFGSIEDVPLIARRARHSRPEVRAGLGLSEAARVVLLSFGGFSARALDLRALGRLSQYVFVLTPLLGHTDTRLPANVLALDRTPDDYVSLLAACDAVVTKPGYGIAADCLANRVAMLFADRGPFREYDILAEALPRLGRARHIPREEVLAGHFGPHLEALLAGDAAWVEQRLDGAQVVAERVRDGLTCAKKR
ncbi:MAG TPA: hypothetical protein VF937_07415 [Chloroflexota bacterium]